MRNSLLIGLAVALASTSVLLGGCQTTAVVPAPTPIVSPTLLALDGANLAKACVRVNTAVGYFNDLAFLIPQPYEAAGVEAVKAIGDICLPTSQAALMKSGQSIVAAITKLNGVWQQLQANTKAL